jgi:hypothetical protein
VNPTQPPWLGAYGESTGEVRELIERIRDNIRIWLR